MKSLSRFGFLASLLAVLMLVSLVPAQMPQWGKIVVTVKTDTGDPVADFPVMAVAQDTMRFHRALQYTDDSGMITIDRAPAGLELTLIPLDTLRYTVDPMSARITVIADTTVQQDFVATPIPTDAQITGDVQLNGQPVAGVTVYFFKVPDDFPYDPSGAFLGSMKRLTERFAAYKVTTDDNGHFALDVMHGTYIPHVLASMTDPYFAYWGNKLTVEAGGTAYLQILLKEPKTISGTISNFDKYEYVKVSAYALDGGRVYGNSDVFSIMEDGSYSIRVAAPDTFVVRVDAFKDDNDEEFVLTMFYDGVYNPREATKVPVSDNVTGIDFNLPEPNLMTFTISGMVSDAGDGSPIHHAHVFFRHYNFAGSMFNSLADTTDASGMYTVQGRTILAQDSVVGAAFKDGYFGQFYNMKTSPFEADPIKFGTDNLNVTGIDFSLTKVDTSGDKYSISGTVTDVDGNVIPFGQVKAISNTLGVVYTQIDSMGHYDFGSIFDAGSLVGLQAWSGFGYIPVIYDGVYSWDQATFLTMDADQTADFTMQETRHRINIGRIAGHIRVRSGDGFAKANAASNLSTTLYLKKVGEDVSTATTVNSDGSYTLPVESYGQYYVTLTAYDPATDTKYTQTAGPVEVKEGSLAIDGVDFDLTATSVGGNPGANVIRTNQLYNAYPNPFNPSTTIRVDMAANENVSLIVYNVLGQKVKTLYNGVMEQGPHYFKWNGKDNSGAAVASGLYFYQLKSSNGIQTKRMLLMK